MSERCYTDTLDNTVEILEDGSTFVLTGDIPAMWLRDSTAQLRPYLHVATYFYPNFWGTGRGHHETEPHRFEWLDLGAQV